MKNGFIFGFRIIFEPNTVELFVWTLHMYDSEQTNSDDFLETTMIISFLI